MCTAATSVYSFVRFMLRFVCAALSLVVLCVLRWNALAKASPFDLGSPCVGAVVVGPVSGPCLRAPGRGEPGFRGGLCPGRVVFLLLLVILDLKL